MPISAQLFLLLVNGLLHCPTGQKEGIDTVILALLENKTERAVNFEAVIDRTIAIKKSAFFKTAILTKGADNTQNVHLISTYEQRLKEELGLSNVLDYREKMGIMGGDPFNNNPFNALQIFYDLVTPNRLVDWVLEKVPSSEELKLLERREELEKKLHNGSPNRNIEVLESRLNKLKEENGPPENIKGLENLLAQQTKGKEVLSVEERGLIRQEIKDLHSKIGRIAQFKPIDNNMIMTFLINKEGPDHIAEYFTADPTIERTAVLTREGALRLLAHLGYVNSNPKGI